MLAEAPASPAIVRWTRHLWQTHPPLLLSGLATVTLGVLFTLGLLLDDRYVTGAPVWLKPLKFAVSVTLYSFTLLWMISLVEGRRRLVSVLVWIVIVALALEFVVLIVQAARGTTSHFNVQTPLDGALFSLMGVAIGVLWLANLGLAVLLLRMPGQRPSLALGVRLALGIGLLGMAEGFLMTMPTAQQLAGWQLGAPVTIVGAHSVGVPDGGPGLPVVGWSTQGGDLRVGHFVGMHALQVLPLVALLLGRVRRLREDQRTALVTTAGVLYLGLTLLVTAQALRAQPLLAPDALTAGTFAALVGAAITASLLILRRPAR